MLLLPPSIDEADESWLQRFSYWEKKCGLTEEEKAKHLIDVLGNNSKLTEEEKAKRLIDVLGDNSKLIHSLPDKFFDKFTIEQIMGRAVLERVKGFLKILTGHDINKALNRWNEFEKCITTPEMVEALINRFNAGLEQRIVQSKLDLDTLRKDTLYKQTEAALREALSAGPGPGESAKPAAVAYIEEKESVYSSQELLSVDGGTARVKLANVNPPGIVDDGRTRQGCNLQSNSNSKDLTNSQHRFDYSSCESESSKKQLSHIESDHEIVAFDVTIPSDPQQGNNPNPIITPVCRTRPNNKEGTEKSMSSKSSLGTGQDINDSVCDEVMTVLNEQPSTRKRKQPSPNSSGCRKQSKELMTSERSLNAPDSNDEKRAKTRECIRKWRSKQNNEAKEVANKITETREKKKKQDERIRTLQLKIVEHLSHDQSDNKTNSSKELKERIQALHLEIVHHLSQSGSDHVTTSQGSSGKQNIELGREQYSAKAWKAMLEKTRYQERKNKLENNLRELEKLQQDVQELSSKAQQWKQEWKMIKAEGLMKEQQEVMSQQVVLPSHQTSDQLDVNGGPSDTQGFFKGLDELRFDEQRHDAPKPM